MYLRALSTHRITYPWKFAKNTVLLHYNKVNLPAFQSDGQNYLSITRYKDPIYLADVSTNGVSRKTEAGGCVLIVYLVFDHNMNLFHVQVTTKHYPIKFSRLVIASDYQLIVPRKYLNWPRFQIHVLQSCYSLSWYLVTSICAFLTQFYVMCRFQQKAGYFSPAKTVILDPGFMLGTAFICNTTVAI